MMIYIQRGYLQIIPKLKKLVKRLSDQSQKFQACLALKAVGDAIKLCADSLQNNVKTKGGIVNVIATWFSKVCMFDWPLFKLTTKRLHPIRALVSQQE